MSTESPLEVLVCPLTCLGVIPAIQEAIVDIRLWFGGGGESGE